MCMHPRYRMCLHRFRGWSRWWRGRPRCGAALAELASEDRDERHHLAGVPAEVVRERERTVVVDPALLGGLAAELEPRLEHHAQSRRAHRMAEALQTAVGVH